MTLIALTGGIASGKSTIARRFVELGAHLIDSDIVAREVVQAGEETLTRIAEEFGAGVLRENGELDRVKLGEIVFTNPDRLERLNSIIHPAIRARSDEHLRSLREREPNGIFLFDIPLLVESGHGRDWGAVIVAEAPEEVRVKRMIDLRGMTEDEARARIAQQATDEERRTIADYVIDTSGTIEWTLEQVDRVWQKISHNR